MTDTLSPHMPQPVKCPVCGKEAAEQYTPFCSKRCADIDLNRWLSGVYVVHTDEEPSPEEIETALKVEKS